MKDLKHGREGELRARIDDGGLVPVAMKKRASA
jgi:hypothetical protein